MRKKSSQKEAGILTKNRRRRTWKRVVGILSCIVVFCTTYALILPAITLEKTPNCEGNLHRHTEECYDENQNPVCGYADFFVHQHTEVCYDNNGTLWCPLNEIEAHTHGEGCYAQPVREEVHTHTDECYLIERGDLICTESEEAVHVHNEECYTKSEALVCDIPESDEHQHGTDCYETTSALTCPLNDQPHQHTDDCYVQNRTLNCKISTEPAESAAETPAEPAAETSAEPEAETPAEPVLICEKTEIMLHEHTTEQCFEIDEAGNTTLICDKLQVLEHEHDENCFQNVEKSGEISARAGNNTEITVEGTDNNGAKYTVTVSYDAAAATIPENAELKAKEYNKTTDEYKNRYMEAGELYGWIGDHTERVRLFNVGFFKPGETQDYPHAVSGPITVTITCFQPGAIGCQVTYCSGTGTEPKNISDTNFITNEDGSHTITFPLDSLNPYTDDILLTMEIAQTEDVVPGALDGEKIALYNSKHNAAVYPFNNNFLGSGVLDVPSLDETKNHLHTLITSNETTYSWFRTYCRVFTFKSADSSDGYYLTVSAGDSVNYVKMAGSSLGVTDNKNGASIFRVAEGSGAYEGQIMLCSDGQAVKVVSNYYAPLTTAPIPSEDDPNLGDYYFYMVNRAHKPVGIVPYENTSGSVMNVFDYWVTEPDGIDQSMLPFDFRDQCDTGINKDHQLKFLSEGNKYEGWNDLTSNHPGINDGSCVYQGIVNNTLGTDGYPYLNAEKTDHKGNKINSSESLAYLFDPDAGTPYRAVHRNVSGLLRINEDGYHEYDSRKNYAYLCEPDGKSSENRKFTLYDQKAVSTEDPNNSGQFFPFNGFDTAIEQETDGGAVQELNHYFGLTLTSRFYQLQGGKRGTKDITFDFSGDDDVWIFIDDVLVADLGGIHGRSEVTINFATGEVIINKTKAEPTKISTTIKAAFEAAGRNTTGFNGYTLPDNTYHTLKFFYMERGASQSNLHLKYNLVNFPASGITKVDQIGDPVHGAEFTLYHANEKYEYNATDDLICSGVTGDNGEFVFLNTVDNQPMTLQDLYSKYYVAPYFVLKETKIPEGYRGTGADIHLKIHTTLESGVKPTENESNIPYVMVCENTRESGAWAAPILQVTAPNTFTPVGGTEVTFYNSETGELNGDLFGVVLKYVGKGGDIANQNNWMPVYGSSKEGYTLVDPEGYGKYIDAVLEADKHYGGQNHFRVAASGQAEATIEELPGDIQTYNFLSGNTNPKFIVAYYYTDKAGNTSRVRDYNDTGIYSFTRNFGTSIQVPNMINRFAVQKLDEDKNTPLNGAVFAMYEVEDKAGTTETHKGSEYYFVVHQNEGEDIHLFLEADTNENYSGKARLCSNLSTEWPGTYTVNQDTGDITVIINGVTYTIQPVQVKTSVGQNDSSNHYLEDGIAEFERIPSGKYVVRELTAPKGYAINHNHALVLVTENAIYANAGTADDGIAVSRGPGYLATNLHGYASFGDVNNTLTWVYAQMKVSEPTEYFTEINPESYKKWTLVTKRRDGQTLSGQPLTSYLVYQPQAEDSSEFTSARFSYAVDNKINDTVNPRPRTVSDNPAPYRRLYTETGWSYLEIMQDYDYGKTAKNPNAEYEDWRYVPGTTNVRDDLSNLFSRSIYIHVTDSRKTDLEISKTVERAEKVPKDILPPPDQMFEFTVKLTQGGNALNGGYKYTVYENTDSGARTEIKNGELTFTDGSANISLKHKQSVVIQGIPDDAQYTITETPVSNFTTSAVEKVKADKTYPTGKKTYDSGTVSGSMYWNVTNGQVDNLSKVDFTNIWDPPKATLTIRKVDEANRNLTLSGAVFTLTNKENKYYSANGWIDTKTKFATDDKGEIKFANIYDGVYTLTEEKAPDGYYLLSGAIQITVENCEIKSAIMNGTDVTIGDDKLTLIVPNAAGYELPGTGGMGTTLFYVSGTILAMGAAILLINKRRMRVK